MHLDSSYSPLYNANGQKPPQGMTEFIPNPKQARQDLTNQHALDLIITIHERLRAVEKVFGLNPKLAHQCQETILKIQDQEKRIQDHPQNQGGQS